MEMVERLAAVRSRVAAAAGRAGRRAADIRLMAVTKNFPRETVLAAAAAGLTLFGENRVQEAEEKFADIGVPHELHLIGHLQRNKARSAAGLFSWVQSIDKVDTAQALESRCAEKGLTMNVLLELNTSGEASKSGFHSRADLLAALDIIRALPHLAVRGLMTVGPLSEDESRIRASFSSLRALFDEIRPGFPGFDTLSMGMSGDFESAIEEGSTLVRIGTALFGQRVAP
jgi:pyridoxal phosphate enzyme (YggS family)